MKRIAPIAIVLVLCACGSSGGTRATTETPDIRQSNGFTRLETPNGGSLIIDWQHEHTYEETPLLVGVDKAWSAFPTVFGELGIQPGIVDQKQHVFGNAGFKVRGSIGRQRLSRYIDCGTTAGMSNADTYDVIVRIVSQVVPADAGLASLRTQVEASAHASAISGSNVRCVSTGQLEERVAHMMSELAAKPTN
ncbi:MAG: hypothetical protein ABI884_00560 [Gemmatimonadota bacterium]